MNSGRAEPDTISVVIPVFNGARWLGEQLDALCNQSREDFEVVVADNGSTDGSVALARSYSSRLDVTVIDASGRRGQAAARNAGARAARGAVILFVDQDDVVASHYVEAMARALLEAEFVAARMDPVLLNPGWRAGARELAQSRSLHTDPVSWAYAGTFGVRREVFDRVGGFDEDLNAVAAEDVDFCIRAAKLGVAPMFVGDALLHYRFPVRARDFYRQGVRYGYAGAAVAARHGYSVTRNVPAFLRSAAGPLRLVVFGRTKAERVRGLFLLGRRVGAWRARRSC